MRIKAGRIWLTTWKTCSRTSEKNIKLFLVKYLCLTMGAAAAPAFDFGLYRDQQLQDHSRQLFGVHDPIEVSSTASVDKAIAEADPTSLATFAQSLRVRVVTAAANAGPNIDMIALWPDDRHPTHLIVCNEEGATEPGVQRVRLSDGLVETILTGTVSLRPCEAHALGHDPGRGRSGSHHQSRHQRRVVAGDHSPAADHRCAV